MAIWDESKATNVKKDCVTTFVVFDDDLQVLIRIFLDGFVVSEEKILQKVLFGVRSIYFSRRSKSVYSFEFREYVWVDTLSDLIDDFFPNWLPTYMRAA